MTSLDSGRFALSVGVAVAMLAGCGGSQPPIGAPGAMPQSRAIATHAERGGSWMLPEAKGEDLLYAANANAGTVTVYKYKTRTLVGTINVGEDATQTGECVNKAGDIYITGGYDRNILEFAHGGTQPIATLDDNGSPPFACSVDFQSGDLAVANLDFGYSSYSTQGNLTIFKKHERAQVYKDKAVYFVDACGYDDQGNLLVSGGAQGTRGYGPAAFAILPKGRHKLIDITLSPNQGKWPLVMGIQWDGRYWAVTVPVQGASETVYRFSIVNGKAKAMGKTDLGNDAGYYGQTWITRSNGGKGRQIVAGLGYIGYVQYYKYPTGGNSFASITDTGYPAGVTVSLAPSP